MIHVLTPAWKTRGHWFDSKWRHIFIFNFRLLLVPHSLAEPMKIKSSIHLPVLYVVLDHGHDKSYKAYVYISLKYNFNLKVEIELKLVHKIL